MTHLLHAFAASFPMQVEITRTSGADDFTNAKIYADDKPRNAADYIESLIANKGPDKVYEATIPFGNSCRVHSLEDGYRIRYNAPDAASLEAFLEALSRA